MKHAPATPLPWEETFDTSDETWGLCVADGGDVLAQLMNEGDAKFALHAANAYPRLVEMLTHALDELEAPDISRHWTIENGYALLRELGELDA